MTWRITRLVIGEDLVVLRISGRITRDDVNAFSVSLEQEKTASAIDLKEVLLMDHEAVRILELLESKGTEIKNCPLHIREWITRKREGK